MPANEQNIDVEFPAGGMQTDTEFQEQPPGTTPLSVNCRALEQTELRERGGSRMGSVRFVPGPVPSGANVIQHLNVIVDPQNDRVPNASITPGPDWIEDVLNPGYYYPPGGWGYPPVPGIVSPEQPGAGMAFVQGVADSGSGSMSLTLPSPVTVGTIIFVVVGTYDSDASPFSDPLATVTVANGGGTPYTQIGSYVRAGGAADTAGVDEFIGLSVWYKVVNNVLDDVDVDLTTTETNIYAGVLNYSGVATSSPISTSASATSGGTQVTNIATGNVTFPDDAGLLIASWFTNTSLASFPEASPTATIRNTAQVVGLVSFDQLNLDGGSSPINTTVTLQPPDDSNARYAVVMGVSFVEA